MSAPLCPRPSPPAAHRARTPALRPRSAREPRPESPEDASRTRPSGAGSAAGGSRAARHGSGPVAVDLLVVEPLDVPGDLVERVLDREVAAVEHVQLSLGKVAQVRLPAFGGEEDVVLSPQDQRLRPALAQERLPLRIELDVRSVVVEEIELHLAGARALEEVEVHIPVVGADPIRVAVSVRVDELDPIELEEGQERRFCLGAAVEPERMPDPVPGHGEALLLGVRVLDHLPLEPVRVSAHDAVTDRPAVVLVVEPERVEAGLLEHALDAL